MSLETLLLLIILGLALLVAGLLWRVRRDRQRSSLPRYWKRQS